MVASGTLNLDCTKCSKFSEAKRRAMGCLGPNEHPIFTFAGKDIYECPQKLLTQETIGIMTVVAACKQFNQLPVPGGVLAQTAVFCQAAGVLESTINEILFPRDEKKSNAE